MILPGAGILSQGSSWDTTGIRDVLSQHKQQAVNPLFSLSSVLFASDGSSTGLQIIVLTQKNWHRGKLLFGSLFLQNLWLLCSYPKDWKHRKWKTALFSGSGYTWPLLWMNKFFSNLVRNIFITSLSKVIFFFTVELQSTGDIAWDCHWFKRKIQ